MDSPGMSPAGDVLNNPGGPPARDDGALHAGQKPLAGVVAREGEPLYRGALLRAQTFVARSEGVEVRGVADDPVVGDVPGEV